MKVISVFGSSSPAPGSERYEEARRLGRLLAEAGYAVATGGYMGTMEGTSRGAAEAGGLVIGVTSSQIEAFRPTGPNRWVGRVVHYPTLRQRLLHLVTENDGMIVLPGGVGTLSEMSLAWSFIQVGEMQARPLILLGKIWRDTMQAFIQRDQVTSSSERLVNYALSPDEAVALLAVTIEPE